MSVKPATAPTPDGMAAHSLLTTWNSLPDVRALCDQVGVPGTRVLQFAFDGAVDNPHLPHNYVRNSVAYTGPHDNNTTLGWFEELHAEQRQIVWHGLKRPRGEAADVAHELMQVAWSSVAALALAVHG